MKKNEFLKKQTDLLNVVIHGDNITVLNDIKSMYCKKVDCIYIDPPYNNGETYNFYEDNNSHEEWISSGRNLQCQDLPHDARLRLAALSHQT